MTGDERRTLHQYLLGLIVICAVSDNRLILPVGGLPFPASTRDVNLTTNSSHSAAEAQKTEINSVVFGSIFTSVSDVTPTTTSSTTTFTTTTAAATTTTTQRTTTTATTLDILNVTFRYNISTLSVNGSNVDATTSKVTETSSFWETAEQIASGLSHNLTDTVENITTVFADHSATITENRPSDISVSPKPALETSSQRSSETRLDILPRYRLPPRRPSYSSVNKRKYMFVTPLPLWRIAGYDIIGGSDSGSDHFRVLPFLTDVETNQLLLRHKNRPEVLLKVGKQRHRQHMLPWSPTVRRKVPVPLTSGKWSRRNEIVPKGQQKHPILLTVPVTLSPTTTAIMAQTSSAGNNSKVQSDDDREASNRRKQQLILGAGVVCSLGLGGALVALIGVSAARCRDALLNRRRSNDVDEDDVTSEVSEPRAASSSSSSSSSASSAAAHKNRLTSRCLRQRWFDCCTCFRMAFMRRLHSEDCDAAAPPPDEERKRGDGVESGPETLESAGSVSHGKKSFKDNIPPAAETVNTSGGDPQVSVNEMVESFNRKFRPASASPGAAYARPSSHHTRLYLAKRSPHLQLSCHAGIRPVPASALPSSTLSSSKNIAEKVTTNDSGNATANITADDSRRGELTAERCKNLTTSIVSTVFQHQPTDGDRCCGMTSELKSGSAASPVKLPDSDADQRMQLTQDRAAFEQLAMPAADRPPVIRCQSTVDTDPFDATSPEIGRRQPTTAAVGISRLLEEGASFDVEVRCVDSKNGVSERTTTDKVANNDDAAELNDVIRQSEILKSFRRVAPPRNSNSERRSRHIHTHLLCGSSSVNLTTHSELDEHCLTSA